MSLSSFHILKSLQPTEQELLGKLAINTNTQFICFSAWPVFLLCFLLILTHYPAQESPSECSPAIAQLWTIQPILVVCSFCLFSTQFPHIMLFCINEMYNKMGHQYGIIQGMIPALKSFCVSVIQVLSFLFIYLLIYWLIDWFFSGQGFSL